MGTEANDQITTTTCGYCSTGCNLTVRVEEGQPPKVTATADYPVNGGKACPKGFQLLGHLDAPTRARTPLLRNKNGDLEPVDSGWLDSPREILPVVRRAAESLGRVAVGVDVATGR